MTKEESQQLRNGLYALYWDEFSGGGFSLAVVGILHDGRRFYSCANWTNESISSVASENWDHVDSVTLIATIEKDEDGYYINFNR